MSATANISSLQPRLAQRAAANLPQTTQTAYFTVSGGKCAVKLYGEVTTVIETKDNNIKLVANPTVGADVDLCAVNNITADAVGTMYSLTGTLADAMIATTSGAFEDQDGWYVVAAGTIDLYCSASNTGQTKWSCLWKPIDTGALITSA